MNAYISSAFLCVLLSLTLIPQFAVARLCTGVVMSDGQCIEDASLTLNSPASVGAVNPIKDPSSSISQTDAFQLVMQKCGPDQFNKGAVKYTSPEECQADLIRSINDRYEANYKKGLAEAKKNGSRGGDGGGAGGSPASGGGDGGGSGAGQGGGGGEQAQNNQTGASDQPMEDSSHETASRESERADEPMNLPGASCVAAVKEHLKRCEKSREKADVTCDPAKDKGIAESEKSAKETGMLANSSNNVNRVATMSAYDQYSSSVSIAGFAEKCDRDSRGCERSCLTVKRAFEKYCSRASAQERAQAQQLVGQAEGDKNKLYCVAVLGRKVEQARAQSKVMGETAEQHAQIHDQSTGQGGAGGDGGMGAGLAGLLQNMQQNQQKKKEEMEALKKAHEAAIAAEGLSQACLRPEFRDLEKCQCRGLTADQCRAKMPTPAPNVRAIQENMLRAPAQYGP